MQPLPFGENGWVWAGTASWPAGLRRAHGLAAL